MSRFDHYKVNLFAITFASTIWMRARPIRFACLLPRIPSPGTSTDVLRPIHILHKPAGNLFSLPAVSNALRDELFRVTDRGRQTKERLHYRPHSRCVPDEEPRSPLHAAGYCVHSPMPILTSAESRSRSPVRGQQFFAGYRPIGLDALNRRK